MKKVVIIGIGNVGKAYAYSLINKNFVDEIVLIDTNENVLKGNYLDLKDASILSNTKIKIGDYSECKDADIVALTAGLNQKENETRLDLLNKNKEIIESITKNVVNSGFNGIFLVATNPVDVLTYLVYKYSGFDKSKIIGSGTFLDTLRLKKIISDKLNVQCNNIDAYVLGEHGDSSFPVWSNIKINKKSADNYLTNEEKLEIEKDVRKEAYKIINYKGETSFGIGFSLSYLTYLILNDIKERVVVSSINYNVSISNVYLIGKNGLELSIDLSMTSEEYKKQNESIDIIKKAISSLEEDLL